MNNLELRRRAEQLSKQPYFFRVDRSIATDGERVYVATVIGLDGCMGQGDTFEEAIQDVRTALVDFIESLLEDGLPVPEPTRTPNLIRAKPSHPDPYLGGEKLPETISPPYVLQPA